MSLKGLAQKTLEICRSGTYRLADGTRVSVKGEVERAIQGTKLYRPTDEPVVPSPSGSAPRVEVTSETTAAAARRLVEQERESRVVALNFASAKNPGGGFPGGAKAQEEDLARCSALYVCQLTQWAYYEANRATRSMLYTDHIIYSPDVPFFRDERLDLLPAPFCVSIITAPAPNAGELKRDLTDEPNYRETLFRRARKVLAVAAAHGHRTLVLGAWGCGVFRNDPKLVAEAFDAGLAALEGHFDRVVFAVYDRVPAGANTLAFRQQFGR